MVDVQTANESAPIKRSAMLGEESEKALHQRIELAFGHMELRLVQHRLGDVRHELHRPGDGLFGDDGENRKACSPLPT